MTREEILNEANKQVGGHRVEDYGKPEDTFGLIASLWSSYLGVEVSPKDVSMLMCLMKIARAKNDVKSDTYVDLAGYAACGGEIASNQTNEPKKLKRLVEDIKLPVRDPKDFDEVVNALSKIKKERPTLRFMQLIMNALGTSDPYYVEDKEFVEILKGCYKTVFTKEGD